MSYLFTPISYLGKTFTITAQEPSIYPCVRERERERTCVHEKSVCLCERLRDKDRVGRWLCVCVCV